MHRSFLSILVVFSIFFDVILPVLGFSDRSNCYSTYSWYILPCFWQLRLPSVVGYVLATAVAYCQGVGEWTGKQYRVIHSLAVWWPPSPGLMLSPGGIVLPGDYPEYLAMPVVR